MRQIRRLALLVGFCLCLAACFTSPEPLIGPEDAAFPFARLVFQVADGSGDPQVLFREGHSYRMSKAGEMGEPSAFVRLRSLGNDVFAAQFVTPGDLSGDTAVPVLYAVIVAGEGGADFASYAAIRPDDFEAVPGLATCERNVCIEDFDAYVAYAMARIEGGGRPDVVYRILEQE